MHILLRPRIVSKKIVSAYVLENLMQPWFAWNVHHLNLLNVICSHFLTHAVRHLVDRVDKFYLEGQQKMLQEINLMQLVHFSFQADGEYQPSIGFFCISWFNFDGDFSWFYQQSFIQKMLSRRHCSQSNSIQSDSCNWNFDWQFFHETFILKIFYLLKILPPIGCS